MFLWWYPRHLLLPLEKIIFWASLPLLFLLLPVALLWQMISFLRKQLQLILYRSSPTKLPILLVGNIVVGGGGKTSVVAMLCRYFPRAVVLVKNYKTSWRGKGDAILLEKNKKNHFLMDEAILHSQYSDVVLCKNRRAGLTLIEKLRAKKKYNIIIADDGFEDYSFRPTLTLLTLQADFYLGNGWLLPLGPLRQFLSVALNNQHRPPAGLLLLRDGFYETPSLPNIKQPVFILKKNYHPPFVTGQKLYGFAAIARPDSFFTAIKKHHGHLVGYKKFSDHHYFSKQQLHKLTHLAQHHRAKLITTKKDFVRLPPDIAKQVLMMPQTIVAEPKLIAFLKSKLYNMGYGKK
ncbi:MAG: tetraacyldisaccharide 4'-kinase [Alphaproteobacteria bacterium]